MKDIEITFSHIVARKLTSVREKSGMSVSELAAKVGKPQPLISMILNRSRKGTPEIFEEIGEKLGIPETKMKSMILESMLEAVQQESGKDFKLAFKNYLGSSPELRDIARAVLAIDDSK